MKLGTFQDTIALKQQFLEFQTAGFSKLFFCDNHTLLQ